MEKEIIPKIGLDVDEVIADFIGSLCKHLNLKERPKFWNFTYSNFFKDEEEQVKLLEGLPRLVDPGTLLFEPVCYITSRSVDIKVTEKWIEGNGFPCCKVWVAKDYSDKVMIAEREGLDIFVEDNYNYYRMFKDSSVRCLLMDAPHNQRYNVGSDRIYNVNEAIWKK